jgi:nicotinamide riboside kinase
MAAVHESRDITVCLTGPESTGKTTLAEALGRHFDAPVVAEVARDYLSGRSGYSAEDVLEITRRQLSLEARARAEHRGLLVLDTDVLVLAVWWQERYGALPPLLEEALRERTPRVYLLACPDIPWAADPLREHPFERERLFERYRALLRESKFPHALIEGSGLVRLEGAVRAVERLTEP